MKALLIFLTSFFLVVSCTNKEEWVIQQQPLETEVERIEVEEKKPEVVVDISNELNELRVVPDESGKVKRCIAYRDADGDGYGDSQDSIEYDCAIGPKVGYTEKKGDCNDRNRYINPGAVEICNGYDDNCDGIVDPEGSEGCNRYYKDMDGDGVGVAEFKCLCVSEGVFRALETGDCDDQNKFVHPNAKEQCNGLDDNCNGQIDEGENLKGCRPFYFDKDGDGFAYLDKSKCLCKPQGLYRAELLGDCNDNNPDIHPDAIEIFDRIDNNCNGLIDENVGMRPKYYKKKKHHGKHHGKHRAKPPGRLKKRKKEIIKNDEEKKKEPKKNSAVIF